MKGIIKFVLVLMILPMIASLTSALELEIVNTNPAPVVAGEFADITVRVITGVENTRFTNAYVELDETQYFRQISEQNALREISPGQTVTRTIRIFISEDLPEGFVDIPLKFESDQLQAKYLERIFVEGSELNPELVIGQIDSIPKELLPDTEDNKITINVQNLGEKDAELVKATLITSDDAKPSYSFSDEDSIAKIVNGGEGIFEFYVDIEETAKENIPAILKLRFRTEKNGNYETFNEELAFNLDIIDAPLLKITNVEQMSSFQGGTTENKLIVEITNEGLEDAEEVRIRLVPDISYPFIFEQTTEYVSSKIAPGKTSRVEFVAEVTSDAQDRDYQITAKLESLVGEARYVREDTLNIKTTPGDSVSATTIGLIIVLTVVLIGGYIGFKRRKK